MQISLAGRTAVITGGSKGIGLAMAKRFAQSGRRRRDRCARARGAGASGRGPSGRPQGAWSASPPTSAIAADVRRAYDEAMAAFGKIDIVVNNAGTARNGAVREHQRRDLAAGPRSKAVRRDPAGAARLAADEGAALGPHHQRAQYRRQGAAQGQRADLGQPRGRHGADQGAGGRGRAAQYSGQRPAGRHHRKRPARPERRRRRRHPGRRVSRAAQPRTRRSGGRGGRRSSPISPAFSPPTPGPTSPARRSTSTAGARRWSSRLSGRTVWPVMYATAR